MTGGSLATGSPNFGAGSPIPPFSSTVQRTEERRCGSFRESSGGRDEFRDDSFQLRKRMLRSFDRHGTPSVNRRREKAHVDPLGPACPRATEVLPLTWTRLDLREKYVAIPFTSSPDRWRQVDSPVFYSVHPSLRWDFSFHLRLSGLSRSRPENAEDSCGSIS